MNFIIENKHSKKTTEWKIRVGGIIWRRVTYKFKVMDEIKNRAQSKITYFGNSYETYGMSLTPKQIGNIIETTFEKGTPPVFKSLREALEKILD